MNDVLPAKPPGHTCPGIDDARTAMRRLARAADDPLSSSALTEALAALERVREENVALREAYVEAMAFRHIAVEAVALVRSGYDGALLGEAVSPLVRAINDYDRAKRRHAKRAPEKTA